MSLFKKRGGLEIKLRPTRDVLLNDVWVWVHKFAEERERKEAERRYYRKLIYKACGNLYYP